MRMPEGATSVPLEPRGKLIMGIRYRAGVRRWLKDHGVPYKVYKPMKCMELGEIYNDVTDSKLAALLSGLHSVGVAANAATGEGGAVAAPALSVSAPPVSSTKVPMVTEAEAGMMTKEVDAREAAKDAGAGEAAKRTGTGEKIVCAGAGEAAKNANVGDVFKDVEAIEVVGDTQDARGPNQNACAREVTKNVDAGDVAKHADAGETAKDVDVGEVVEDAREANKNECAGEVTKDVGAAEGLKDADVRGLTTNTTVEEMAKDVGAEQLAAASNQNEPEMNVAAMTSGASPSDGGIQSYSLPACLPVRSSLRTMQVGQLQMPVRDHGTCDRCNAVFATLQEQIAHEWTQHRFIDCGLVSRCDGKPLSIFVCPLCDIGSGCIYATASELCDHIREHVAGSQTTTHPLGSVAQPALTKTGSKSVRRRTSLGQADDPDGLPRKRSRRGRASSFGNVKSPKQGRSSRGHNANDPRSVAKKATKGKKKEAVDRWENIASNQHHPYGSIRLLQNNRYKVFHKYKPPGASCQIRTYLGSFGTLSEAIAAVDQKHQKYVKNFRQPEGEIEVDACEATDDLTQTPNDVATNEGVDNAVVHTNSSDVSSSADTHANFSRITEGGDVRNNATFKKSSTDIDAAPKVNAFTAPDEILIDIDHYESTNNVGSEVVRDEKSLVQTTCPPDTRECSTTPVESRPVTVDRGVTVESHVAASTGDIAKQSSSRSAHRGDLTCLVEDSNVHAADVAFVPSALETNAKNTGAAASDVTVNVVATENMDVDEGDFTVQPQPDQLLTELTVVPTENRPNSVDQQLHSQQYLEQQQREQARLLWARLHLQQPMYPSHMVDGSFHPPPGPPPQQFMDPLPGPPPQQFMVYSGSREGYVPCPMPNSSSTIHATTFSATQQFPVRESSVQHPAHTIQSSAPVAVQPHDSTHDGAKR